MRFLELGVVIFAFGIILLYDKDQDLKTSLIMLILALGILLMYSFHDYRKGAPLTSIETGDYLIVSYAETASGDGPMYQMILKQNNEMRFYALPKNMITIDKSNGKSSALEVIEKAGFKKAIMRP